MDISVVIPTCNRPDRLRSLLGDLGRSTHPITEALVVDSSDRPLRASELPSSPGLFVEAIESKVKSVCVQRNIGIRRATAPWIFLCDDDVEVPPDYLAKLAAHAHAHPEAGALSGLFLEREGAAWKSEFPVTSELGLLWRYLFQLGIWGQITARGPIADRIAARYRELGNHLSRAGWPVLTDFTGPYFRTPVYTLGASLVRKEWLLRSPYDERLDPHGLGDNYGVALGFPEPGIHVVTSAFVRHHKDPKNRLAQADAYARRLLALHYFIRSRKELTRANEGAFLWSLAGQLAFHTMTGNPPFARAAWVTLRTAVLGKNPYLADEGKP